MTTKQKPSKPPSTTERDWQRTVIQLAHTLNWRIAHFRATQTQTGRWLTPVAADGAGFPDLVLVRDRIIFAELKINTNTLSDNQIIWSAAINNANGEWHLWRPRDLELVISTLKRNTSAK